MCLFVDFGFFVVEVVCFCLFVVVFVVVCGGFFVGGVELIFVAVIIFVEDLCLRVGNGFVVGIVRFLLLCLCLFVLFLLILFCY